MWASNAKANLNANMFSEWRLKEFYKLGILKTKRTKHYYDNTQCTK